MAKKTDTIKYSLFLKKPRITEKSSILAEGVNNTSPVYTFEVPQNANKTEVKKSFFEKYNINPRKINMINLPAKKVGAKRHSKAGSTSRIKKALVYLKPGEKIDIV